MLQHIAVKFAALGMGALATATGLIAQAVESNGTEGTVLVISGGAVMTAALGLFVQLGRMWSKGQIVSKVTDDDAKKLTQIVEDMHRLAEEGQAREAQLSRIVEAYLPDKGSS